MRVDPRIIAIGIYLLFMFAAYRMDPSPTSAMVFGLGSIGGLIAGVVVAVNAYESKG